MAYVVMLLEMTRCLKIAKFSYTGLFRSGKSFYERK